MEFTREVPVQDGDDLERTAGRAIYRDCRVGEIRNEKGDEFLELRVPGSEHYLQLGEAWGDVDTLAVQREMIRRTIREHLDKEKRLRPQGIKVLSLFFIDAVGRYRQYDEDGVDAMRADFAAAFATRDRDDWVAELGPADACVSAVQTVPEVVDDDHFAARGAFTEVRHPTEGPFRQVNAVLAGQGDAATMTVRDQTATTTDEVLAGAGFTVEEIEQLRSEGVVA